MTNEQRQALIEYLEGEIMYYSSLLTTHRQAYSSDEADLIEELKQRLLTKLNQLKNEQ